MRKKIAKISKRMLFFVVVGFFMPIACDSNGFLIGSVLMRSGETFFYGLLVYAVFIGALFSIIFSFTKQDKKSEEPIVLDWFLLALSSASGLFCFFKFMFRNEIIKKIQVGGYIIVLGWILSFIFLLIATLCKDENQTEKGEIDTDTCYEGDGLSHLSEIVTINSEEKLE